MLTNSPITDSALIAHYIVQSLLANLSAQINNEKIKLKLAPINVRKSALYTLESLNLMETQYIQLPERVGQVQKSDNIKLDTLAIKKIGIRLKKNWQLKDSEAPRPLLKKKTGGLNDRKMNKTENRNKNNFGNDKSQIYEIPKQKFSEMKRSYYKTISNNQKSSKNSSNREGINQNKSSRIFTNRLYKISERKLNTISNSYFDETDSAEDALIEGMKKRIFFIEEEQSQKRQRLRMQSLKYNEQFSQKCERVKKIGERLSFDYSGEPIQSNETLKAQLDIIQLAGRPSKLIANHKQSGLKTDLRLGNREIKLNSKKSQSISIKSRICTEPTFSSGSPKSQNIEEKQGDKTIQQDSLPFISEKVLDPVSQITEQNISEGVKIYSPSSNIFKQKLSRINQISQKFQNLKQYNEYVKVKPFKQYTLHSSPKSSITLEARIEDNYQTLEQTKDSQLNGTCNRFKKKEVGKDSEQMNESILSHKKAKRKQLGQIIIDNSKCYDQFFQDIPLI